jgi:hypothetical protein
VIADLKNLGNRLVLCDLVFVHEEGMIDNMTYSEVVGNSNHLIMEWSLTCYIEPVATRVVKYRYDKAKSLICELSWQKFAGMNYFLANLLTTNGQQKSSKLNLLVDAFVLHSPGSGTSKDRQHREPLWMNDRVLTPLKKKTAFEQYM